MQYLVQFSDVDAFRVGLMSFPKAKRFTDHASQGPGPNAYDVVFAGSERLVGDQITDQLIIDSFKSARFHQLPTFAFLSLLVEWTHSLGPFLVLSQGVFIISRYRCQL